MNEHDERLKIISENCSFYGITLVFFLFAQLFWSFEKRDMKDMSNREKNMSSVSYEDYKSAEENPSEPAPPAGILWRMGSGMYNITKGTVGVGVGAVKFVANSSVSAVSKTTEVGVNATKAVASVGYNAVSGTGSYVSGGVSAVTSKLPAVPLPTFKKTKDKEE